MLDRVRFTTLDDPMEAEPLPPVEPPVAEGGEPCVREGETVWKIARAARASVLVDGAGYFGALREALKQAKDNVLIAGWDLDSRMKLVGESGTAEDGLPETLVEFLSALVTRNPALRIRLLLWDYSMVFALERELLPIYSFLWNTPPQIEICLDDALPFGASHHQKIVVIDDRVAFSGGLDLTGRRWDTSEHLPEQPLRLDPGGNPYGAFHDVQMVVDGEAAAALGELLRERWRRAACEKLPPVRPVEGSDPWPQAVEADFTQVGIGIARTLPAHEREPIVREVEALFFEMIDRAERCLYLENQFFTCRRTTARILARMRERPELEAMVVMPMGYRSWFEHRAMGVGRERVMRMVDEAGLGGRFRFVYPEVGPHQPEDEAEAGRVMVHSKVTIVDDTLMRIGSANLCNRSMGFDSECDLVVEAADAGEREGIAAVRNRLLGEHVGRAPEEVGRIIETQGLLAVLDQPGAHRRLAPVPCDPEATELPLPMIDALADPVEPLYEDVMLAPPPRRWRKIAFALAALAAIGALVMAWSYSPFSEPDRMIAAFERLSNAPWAPALVVGAFVLAGLVAFPVTLLILATVAVFDGWAGAVIAACGALASALVTYGIGRAIGQRVVRRFIGPRINRIRRSLTNRGVLAVTTVRLVPAAPFSIVNLVSGAIGIPFLDYLFGTLLGLAPGLIVMTALGKQIVGLLSNPSLGAVALFSGFVVLWIALSLSLQFLVNRLRPAAN